MELRVRWHHVDMATRDLQHLGARVKAHRLRQYPSRDAAAAAAGVTKDTWQRIEEGEKGARDSSYVKVASALGWAEGSWLLVAEGGEPVLAAEFGKSAGPVVVPTEEEAREAAYAAARVALPNASIAAVDAFVDQYLRILGAANPAEGDA